MMLDQRAAVMHAEYSAWASRRLLDAAKELAIEELYREMNTAHRSVLGTLVHIYQADRIWLARLEGEKTGPLQETGDETLDLSGLDACWPVLLGRFVDWTRSTSDLHQDVDFSDTKGRPHRTPRWQILLHVVNHASYHRGQVSAMLRQLGRIPPATDLIHFYRAR